MHYIIMYVLVCIRSYLKSGLRYTFLILDTNHPDILYLCKKPKGAARKKKGGTPKQTLTYSWNTKKCEGLYVLVYLHISSECFLYYLHRKLTPLLIVRCAYLVKKAFCTWQGTNAVLSFVSGTKLVIGPHQRNLITLGVSNGWTSKVPDSPAGTDKPALSYMRWLVISPLMQVYLQTQPSAEHAWNKGLACTPEAFTVGTLKDASFAGVNTEKQTLSSTGRDVNAIRPVFSYDAAFHFSDKVNRQKVGKSRSMNGTPQIEVVLCTAPSFTHKNHQMGAV